MSKLRQGDLYLFDTIDGGEIKIVNGEPEMDGGFESSSELSLFGHDGTPFWMDEYLEEAEKPGGKFHAFMNGNAKSTANILRAQKLAELDFKWFLDVKIADKVNVQLISIDRNILNLKVEVLANGEKIFENTYQINWELQKELPANGRQ